MWRDGEEFCDGYQHGTQVIAILESEAGVKGSIILRAGMVEVVRYSKTCSRGMMPP